METDRTQKTLHNAVVAIQNCEKKFKEAARAWAAACVTLKNLQEKSEPQ